MVIILAHIKSKGGGLIGIVIIKNQNFKLLFCVYVKIDLLQQKRKSGKKVAFLLYTYIQE